MTGIVYNGGDNVYHVFHFGKEDWFADETDAIQAYKTFSGETFNIENGFAAPFSKALFLTSSKTYNFFGARHKRKKNIFQKTKKPPKKRGRKGKNVVAIIEDDMEDVVEHEHVTMDVVVDDEEKKEVDVNEAIKEFEQENGEEMEVDECNSSFHSLFTSSDDDDDGSCCSSSNDVEEMNEDMKKTVEKNFLDKPVLKNGKEKKGLLGSRIKPKKKNKQKVKKK